ncbi:MAG: hypothetical protein JNJ46_08190 [Myxococcales bacterium]|nr:hypothetical protein [Myxococcales bacterium]
MKSLIAWSSLALLCLGAVTPPLVQARPQRGEHSALRTSVVSHKGTVTSFGYYVEPDLLSMIPPAACKIQLDTVPGTTFVVNLDLGDAFRPGTEGMCSLARDAFHTGKAISIDEDRGRVLGISVAR